VEHGESIHKNPFIFKLRSGLKGTSGEGSVWFDIHAGATKLLTRHALFTQNKRLDRSFGVCCRFLGREEVCIRLIIRNGC
jgi:hypothetical protein